MVGSSVALDSGSLEPMTHEFHNPNQLADQVPALMEMTCLHDAIKETVRPQTLRFVGWLNGDNASDSDNHTDTLKAANKDPARREKMCIICSPKAGNDSGEDHELDSRRVLVAPQIENPEK